MENRIFTSITAEAYLDLFRAYGDKPFGEYVQMDPRNAVGHVFGAKIGPDAVREKLLPGGYDDLIRIVHERYPEAMRTFVGSCVEEVRYHISQGSIIAVGKAGELNYPRELQGIFETYPELYTDDIKPHLKFIL